MLSFTLQGQGRRCRCSRVFTEDTQASGTSLTTQRLSFRSLKLIWSWTLRTRLILLEMTWIGVFTIFVSHFKPIYYRSPKVKTDDKADKGPERFKDAPLSLQLVAKRYQDEKVGVLHVSLSLFGG